MAEATLSSTMNLGLRRVRERPGLVVLLYFFNVVPAVLLALPFFQAFVDAVGSLGYGPDLLAGFDIMIWANVATELREALQDVLLNLLWVVPFYLVWITAARMGLIYALHFDAIWPFWRGVGYYTGPALLIALLFLPIRVIWFGASVLGSGVLMAVIPGEAGIFWSYAVVMPTLIISGLAVIHLMQRYAQMALVVEHARAGAAVARGMGWPFKHGFSSRLFVAWFAVALLVGGLAAYLTSAWRAVGVAVWMYVIVQQLFLFARTAVSVAWTGSEVWYMESVEDAELVG